MASDCKYGVTNDKKEILLVDKIDGNFSVSDKYVIILIESGTLILSDNSVFGNEKKYSFIGPCVACLKENTSMRCFSSIKFIGKAVMFDVCFFNKYISFESINSGKYAEEANLYGNIPFDMFYKLEGMYYGFLPLNVNVFSILRNWFKCLESIFSIHSDDRWSCKTRAQMNSILELLFQVYREYISNNTHNIETKKPNTWLPIALEFIYTNYKENIALEDVSRFINVDRSTLSSRFKDLMGNSVTDYIIDYRIRCACHSIATTGLTIQEIAFDHGFSSTAYFIKQFKKRMGMTPLRYRHFCITTRNELNESE